MNYIIDMNKKFGWKQSIREHIKMPIELDRRIKLNPEDKITIKELYKEGYGIREMARLYKVDKRLIQFTLFPERQKVNIELRKKRGGSKQYYDKAYNTQKQREHRKYKSGLIKSMGFEKFVELQKN
ncbi:MAG: helix-turn-helix domain-containing protein [Candidatus Nanoarchaeia archaeon]|nr:helix-turn-helix domain-containing protein [Candidatus Nanoarchaeia archaeon]